jgi:DNA-binding CsgD family transcriptional regulator
LRRLSRSDAAGVRAIGEELATVRLDGPSAASVILPQVRTLLRGEVASVHRLREAPTGWGLDLLRIDADAGARARALSHTFTHFVGRSAASSATSVFLRCVPAQRDCVVRPIDEPTREAYEETVFYKDVAHPDDPADQQPLRVQVCEGSSLLAWFGVLAEPRIVPSQTVSPCEANLAWLGVFSESAGRREATLLTALVPALQRRLSFDRRIQDAPRKCGALEAALELLAVPAFVLGRAGAVHEASSSGRALFDSSPAVGRSLRDAALRRPCALDVGLTPLRGEAGGFLALVRSPLDTVRSRCALAATRWSLSRRQTDVLVGVADGLGNAAIAAKLDIALRTVEFHVTAVFDRAGVHTRAALVASLLALL